MPDDASGDDGGRERDRDTAPKGDTYRGRLAAEYHCTRSQGRKWRREQEVMAQLLNGIPTRGDVLDVPFGSGRFAGEYLGRGWRVTGLDSSPDMFASAREVITAEGFDPDAVRMDVGDARALPYEDASFDLVVCVRFLQSVVALGDVPTILAELRRVCRDGGDAVIQLRVPPTAEPIAEVKRPTQRMEHQCGAADQDLLLAAAGFGSVEDLREGSDEDGWLRTVRCRPVAPRLDLLQRVLSWTWIPDTI